MLLRKELGLMNTQEWIAPREKMFADADINNDGSLNYNEAQWFLRYVRKLDVEVINEANPRGELDNEMDFNLERINNHWFLASLGSAPNDSMTFADYV